MTTLWQLLKRLTFTDEDASITSLRNRAAAPYRRQECWHRALPRTAPLYLINQPLLVILRHIAKHCSDDNLQSFYLRTQFFRLFFFWACLNNNSAMRFFMSVFPYPKYGEVNIMFHNFIVSGSIIFMTKEILCANIFVWLPAKRFSYLNNYPHKI